MCRFTLYLGPPIRLSTLVIEPDHSLIRQSFEARERTEPLNGDGFGLGWYAPEVSPEPGLFRSVTPAWNNQNLASLARVVTSPCVLAHVRAATPGMTVSEANCHPFPWRRFLFMHNGHIGSFQRLRRILLDSLGDEAFSLIQGSTDTEHLFAVFVDEVLREGGLGSAAAMASALNRAIWRVLSMVRAVRGAPSFLNVAVADGDRAVVCRFTDHPERAPESLYSIQRDLYRPAWHGSPGRRRYERSPSVVVASERFTDDPAWSPVPPSHLLALERHRAPVVWRMAPDGLQRVDSAAG